MNSTVGLWLSGHEFPIDGERINVTPVDDIYSHLENEMCECKPSIEISGPNLLITHNSYDGRELIEEAYRAMNEDT